MWLEIRSQGLEFSHRLASALERRLRLALGRFATRVGRVMVHLADLSRRCRGTDLRCRIVARLTPTGQVCVDVTETDLDTALNRAAEQIRPAISREFVRRRDERGYLGR